MRREDTGAVAGRTADVADDDGPALVPELLVADVVASLAFWRDLCGFRVRYHRLDEGFAYLVRDGAHVMLEEAGRGRNWVTAALTRPLGRGVNFQIGVADVELVLTAARRVAVIAFAIYLVVLVGVAFFPLPGEPEPGTEGVVPLDLALSRPDLLGGREAQRNLLMTIPFGVLLPLVARWRYELMLLVCVGVTLVIETGQLLGSLAADIPTGVVSEVQLADGGGWQVGVVAPGDDPTTDGAGAPVEALPVEGSELRVWSRDLPLS